MRNTDQDWSHSIICDEDVSFGVEREVDRLFEVVMGDGGDGVAVLTDLRHCLRSPVDHYEAVEAGTHANPSYGSKQKEWSIIFLWKDNYVLV